MVLSTEGGTARLVCDESILSERALTADAKGDILAKYLRKAARSNRYDCKVENEVEASQTEIPRVLSTELPVHCYLLMFHLELHHHLWVHVNDIKPYRSLLAVISAITTASLSLPLAVNNLMAVLSTLIR